jgi:16S rRNA (cytosine967-C5)-methyltransferase
MKDSARLQAVIDLIALSMREARPSDGLISAYFRERRYIGSKDRQAIAGMVYDILRHQARFQWWQTYLKAQHTIEYSRAAAMLHQVLVAGKAPAETAALFNGDKFAPSPLNPVEQAFLGELKGRTLQHPQMDDATAHECPPWAYEKLQAVFGDRLKAELAAMLAPAPLDLRVNVLKATRDEALKKLRAEAIEAEATALSPLGIRVTGRPALAQTRAFQNGYVEIQDEGSQMVAFMLDVKPGMSVVDFCAGAGGKTLALAAAMNNKGRVVACDVLEKRLSRARERFTRAGLHNIELHPLKNEHDPWVKRNTGKYDRVLVDAPCSGTGTWRRNPDARWKNLGPALDELVPLQQSILASAARLVKYDGRLVYATCSLLPDENRMQVDAFLASHPEFARVTDDMLLTPAQHGTDGFFAALLERKSV